MSEILHAVRVKSPEYLNRYLRRMCTVLLGMFGALYLARDVVFTIVQSNLVMNGMIATVFVVGIAICFQNIHRLKCDLRALCDIDKILFGSRNAEALVNYDGKMFIMNDLFKSLQNSAKESGEIPEIPTPVARSMVNIANNRFEERRIRIGYFVNLLIYMGLLGTFIGLSATVSSISGLISNLAMGLSGEQDMTETLVTLIKHLEHPLAGMGTAFGTSLTGLSCSVVLGALAMSVNKAATLFSNTYSNWIYEYAMTSFTAGIEKHRNNQDDATGNAPATGAVATFSEKSEQALMDIEQHLQHLLTNQQTLLGHHEKQLSALGDIYQNSLTHNQAILANHEKQLSALTDLHHHSSSQNTMLDSIRQALSKHDPQALQASITQVGESFTSANDELQKQTHLLVEQNNREDSQNKESVEQRHKIIKSQLESIDWMKKQVEHTDTLCQHSQKLPGSIAAAASKRLKETEQSLIEQFNTGQDELGKTITEQLNTGQDELGKTIEKAESAHRALLLRLFKALHRLYRLFLSRNR